MAERTQIISTNREPVGPGFAEERQTFTVAATPPYDIALDPYVPPGAWPFTTETGILRDGEGNKWLHKKDGFNILSVGIVLPYSFACSTNRPYGTIRYRDSTGLVGVINFGTVNGWIAMPMENFETSIGAFIPWPASAIGSIYLIFLLAHPGVAAPFQFRVSMINAPAGLVGASLPVSAFVKLTQNAQFYAAP
jgi:uncharacterized membrane protein YeaQ/YmgE (transglycosylase-associated protein family)